MATYESEHMAVSHEIKSQLAKLLATEDLVVEHKKVRTAQFNVHTRVLTLPMWEKASNTVYDLLVGHEVGHALFTPDEDPPKGVPHQFVNVVEDCRIEKLMKRRYLGLAKTFYRGYQELNESDFFEIEGQDLNTYNLADKININAKVGNFVKVEFSEKEQEIVDLVDSCETFADVAIASEVLYKFCKQQQDENQKLDNLNEFDSLPSSSDSESQPPVDMEGSSESDDGDEEGSSEQNKTPSSTGEEQDPGDISSGTDYSDDPDVRTADSLENKLKDLVGNALTENNYVELPKVNLDTVIVKNSEFHDYVDESFNSQRAQYTTFDIFEDVDTEYRKFKQTTQKEVNYLVKEFECRKSADSYARATTSRTGILDCTKLHTYKYNEDLFKKVTTLPDGKNHGLIFVLDWSGSMQDTIKDTCKQLFNLVWFCKKVGIPFDVYAFTGEWRKWDYHNDGENPALNLHYEKKDGLLCVHERFSMMNILTSEMSGKNVEKQLLNVWRLACAFTSCWNTKYSYPAQVSLSGTPLNEAIISLHQIIPSFKKSHNLQKVHCIVLTDGEANTVPYHAMIEHGYDREPYMGCRRVNPEATFLRDRKLGMTYKFGYSFSEFTDVLLKNLKDCFPDTSIIGIRVLDGRDLNRFLSLYFDPMRTEGWYEGKEKVQAEWKKTKSFSLKNSGYDVYFGISSNVLSSDSEFEVEEDASKAKIKSAFVKSLKTKKLNKKVLGEFISLVA
tara:strand:- start:3676 stop:5862 length:2187 start_codon:yes stop_codon:yes gene_type:complete